MRYNKSLRQAKTARAPRFDCVICRGRETSAIVAAAGTTADRVDASARRAASSSSSSDASVGTKNTSEKCFVGANRALDKISVTMANDYGNGHPWLGCDQLKKVASCGKPSRMVRKGGLEPPRYCYRQPLKLVRLPIPPLPRSDTELLV